MLNQIGTVRGQASLEKYTLIIAEKPDAANRIASALNATGNARRMQENGVPYYEAMREGRKLIIVPALGHLYTVAAETKNSKQTPILDYKWVPRHQAERGAARTKTWLTVISKLAKHADMFIDACDYDIEG
ncbi:MAG TPA: toprim domain-containing protein, partial [Candidatus Acidoferrales bacterium]|nr:toprim domain-containing protein [Candidatus Acidoferrales bacterium]